MSQTWWVVPQTSNFIRNDHFRFFTSHFRFFWLPLNFTHTLSEGWFNPNIRLHRLSELQAHLKFRRKFVSSVYFIISLPQILTGYFARTVYTTPAIYTSKRAARPGSMCDYFSFRFALRWRRNSQKTTPKNPIESQWGQTQNIASLWSHITLAYCHVETWFKR